MDAIAYKDLLRAAAKSHVSGGHQDNSRGALTLEDSIAMLPGSFLYHPPVAAFRVAEFVGQTDHGLQARQSRPVSSPWKPIVKPKIGISSIIYNRMMAYQEDGLQVY